MKKACVIYILETEYFLDDVLKKLKKDGYDICSVKLERSWKEAKDTSDIMDCQRGAQVCIFLLDKECEDYVSFGSAVGCAQSNGSIIVGISGGGNYIPKDIDEKANSITVIGSQSIDSALSGGVVWEDNQGKPLVKRNIKRIACQ